MVEGISEAKLRALKSQFFPVRTKLVMGKKDSPEWNEKKDELVVLHNRFREQLDTSGIPAVGHKLSEFHEFIDSVTEQLIDYGLGNKDLNIDSRKKFSIQSRNRTRAALSKTMAQEHGDISWLGGKKPTEKKMKEDFLERVRDRVKAEKKKRRTEEP